MPARRHAAWVSAARTAHWYRASTSSRFPREGRGTRTAWRNVQLCAALGAQPCAEVQKAFPTGLEQTAAFQLANLCKLTNPDDDGNGFAAPLHELGGMFSLGKHRRELCLGACHAPTPTSRHGLYD